MKAFTIVELSLVVLIILTLIPIVFSIPSIPFDFFYPKEVFRKISDALSISSNMSFSFLTDPTNPDFNICAYGIYFANSSTLETLAFSSSTYDCEKINTTTNDSINQFISTNLNNKKFLLKNLSISALDTAYFSLGVNLKSGYSFNLSTSSNCSSDFSSVIILYFFKIKDLLIFRNIAGSWQEITDNQFYICLKTPQNENFRLKINKLGQLILER